MTTSWHGLSHFYGDEHSEWSLMASSPPTRKSPQGSHRALYWGHSYSSCILMTFHQFCNHLPNAAFLQMTVWSTARSAALKIKSRYRRTLTHLSSGPSSGVCYLMPRSAISWQSPGQQPPLLKFYQIDNTILDNVDSCTYLGILLTSDMSWSSHISSCA